MADVVLIHWPEEGKEAARLVAHGAAVLYLVEATDDPPAPTTCLEDWVRVPGDDRDLSARLAFLQLRAATHEAPLSIDAGGRVRYRGKTAMLSAQQARLARVLAARFGEVVSDADLASVWAYDGGAEQDSTVRAHLTQLRAQLRQIGLTLRRVRGRGYMLQGR